jgi:DNA replication protein DnaC
VGLKKQHYLPFSPSGGALLFHLLGKLYERTSVVITTNLVFSKWTTRHRARTGGATMARRSLMPT